MFNKRIELNNPTVEELIKSLQQFPKETKVYTCGADTMFIHIDDKNNSICLDEDGLEDEYIEQEMAEREREREDYCPSSTYGDYSPSNPWDAPGMSIRDFI